ncbi:MAG: Uroporphyrinogen synthase, partial [Pseudomonadota bacterium]
VNYTTEPNSNIDPKLIEDLKNKLVNVIFVYSKRAADQLLKIILNYKIENDLDNCSLNCISINVANTLKRLKWKKIKIFLPGEEELSLL